MVPRPRAHVWARLHRARAQHLVRRSNVTHGDRGFPRARWARSGASGPLASYRDVGRGDRPRLDGPDQVRPIIASQRGYITLDVHAAITLPHFDGWAIRFLGKNLACPELGRVIIGARDDFRRRNMRVRAYEEEPVHAQPRHAFDPFLRSYNNRLTLLAGQSRHAVAPYPPLLTASEVLTLRDWRNDLDAAIDQ